jgi:uroporphyrinogen decarboxylase
MTTSRALVQGTLTFENTDGRVPRQLWDLPWASLHHPDELSRIHEKYPDDIVFAPIGDSVTSEGFQAVTPGSTPSTEGRDRPLGDPYARGTYVDPWGCLFTNFQPGIIGEVKKPLLRTWKDLEGLSAPEFCLEFDVDGVNDFCRDSDRFVLSGDWARPFERMQFIRGTEQLFVDLVERPPGLEELMGRVHRFYCRLLDAWAHTEVDGLWFMDDWGSQNSLLINPDMWRERFKPLYADYVDIAHGAGKKIFMHSDGYILDIIPHLIDIGVDGLNSQIFCMGVENLEAFRKAITFWGEIDRQQLLPHGTRADVDEAVRSVFDALWEDGGCIAQCEFGPGANPDNVATVFESWNNLEKPRRQGSMGGARIHPGGSDTC